MSNECNCGGRFMDAEDFRDHLPCYKSLEIMPKTKPNIKWCEKHEVDNGGVRNCLICACEEMNSALSKIDYMIGDPNELKVSLYDTCPDPNIVIKNVRVLIDRLKGLIGICGVSDMEYCDYCELGYMIPKGCKDVCPYCKVRQLEDEIEEDITSINNKIKLGNKEQVSSISDIKYCGLCCLEYLVPKDTSDFSCPHCLILAHEREVARLEKENVELELDSNEIYTHYYNQKNRVKRKSWLKRLLGID